MDLKTSILLVDDFIPYRNTLTHFLGGFDFVRSLFEAETIQQAKHILTSQHVDIILLDISLGNENGLDLLRFVSRQYQTIHVLVVSTYNDPYFVDEAFHWGAKGYLLKDRIHDELPKTITKILTGELIVGSGIA